MGLSCADLDVVLLKKSCYFVSQLQERRRACRYRFQGCIKTLDKALLAEIVDAVTNWTST